MAKKKTKKGPAVKLQTSGGQGDASTLFLWLAAAAGLFFAFVYFAYPWVSVLAAGKNGITLLQEAFAKDASLGGAILFLLVPALLALALPFLPHEWRDGGSIAVAVTGAIGLLDIQILARSTRNLLAMGAGRQTANTGALTFFMVLIIIGAAGALVQKDIDSAERPKEIGWYAAFIGLLIIALYFNYGVIPDSLIPPPEFVRQRLGW